MKLEEMTKKEGTLTITTCGRIFPLEEIDKRPLDSIINYAAILSRLIQEAGTQCKRFASDFIISWNECLLKIRKMKRDSVHTEYFGFREDGVDHEAYIRMRLAAPKIYGENIYRSIFKLEIRADEDHLHMGLTQIL